jgi:4-hydroxy-tetrahydrodipicolinate synthase
MPKDLRTATGSSAIPMTPFTENDLIDEDILAKEIEFTIQCGAASICTPILVSEFEMLSEAERKLLIKLPCDINRGRVAIIANVQAPNAAQAVAYAEYAQKCGADALIAMTPNGVDFDFAYNYFKRISDAVNLPVMIQNHSIHGLLLKPHQVIQLCEEIEHISWVKQEVIPGPMTISTLMKIRTPALVGVMSGFGSQYAPMDFVRGAVACIHACEWTDLIVPVWELLFAGKIEEARKLQSAIQPALEFEGLMKVRYSKEVMIRRGIFKNRIMRRTFDELSGDDMKEIDRIFELVAPYMKNITV